MPVMASLVSAVTADEAGNFATNTIDGIQKVGKPILDFLFGQIPTDVTSPGNELAMQVLAFLLVMLIVYGVLSTVKIFGEKTWINFALGAIIALIGIRFMPSGFLSQMATPSSAFVALLILGIPFFLLFWIIESKITNKAARRAAWAVFAVLIIVLWTYNVTADFWYIYPLIIIGCIIAFWWDGMFQKWFGEKSIKRQEATLTIRAKGRGLGDLRSAQELLAEAKTDAERKQMRDEIANIKKNMESL